MYNVLFTSKSRTQLKKLDLEIQKRIISILERVRIRPESYFKKLVGDSAYKLRIGDYRIIADIDNGN